MTDNHKVLWLGFSASTPDEHARAVFLRRYGVEPQTVKRTGGAVLAGPMPEREKP